MLVGQDQQRQRRLVEGARDAADIELRVLLRDHGAEPRERRAFHHRANVVRVIDRRLVDFADIARGDPCGFGRKKCDEKVRLRRARHHANGMRARQPLRGHLIGEHILHLCVVVLDVRGRGGNHGFDGRVGLSRLREHARCNGERQRRSQQGSAPDHLMRTDTSKRL